MTTAIKPNEPKKDTGAPEALAPNAEPSQQGKRKKTWGEWRFNLVTYGGWALLGNEAASLAITESVGKSFDGKPRFARGIYEKFEGKVASLAKYFEGLKTPGLLRYMGDYIGGMKSSTYLGAHVPRLPYLLVATIGGMLVVPFVKNREDRKGEIVRKLDQKHYGLEHATNDPELSRAHKEMDEAPKQTWGSLWKGRFTTVIFAALADFSFGWPEALTTKLFKNNKTYQKYCSLERFSDVVAEKSTAAATRQFTMSENAQKLMRKVVGNGTWLLTLSSSLTVLFYASSKLFARRRDEKREFREYVRTHKSPERDEAASEQPDAAPAQSETVEKTDHPAAQVNGVLHHKTLAPSESLAPAV